MKAKDDRSDDGEIPLEQPPCRAVHKVHRACHRKNRGDSQCDLRRAYRPGPEPKKVGIRRGVRPYLARHNPCDAASDQEEGDGLIQPKGRADGEEPYRNGRGESQSVEQVQPTVGQPSQRSRKSP